MEELIQLIQANIQYAHLIIFATLLLAGLNIPISEDAMIFVSALLASKTIIYPIYLSACIWGFFFRFNLLQLRPICLRKLLKYVFANYGVA
ncbi:MAG: hypothetical protein H0A75_03100 [Candidatus Methanofishera endochildressiae]|uniref:DedA family protein n=1 Tax=Candidatus Methanofishera endochildressiae TaxID=2738884 RepID=A0A7Z0MN53_9GAMM|nr:hypothetical protein [Candidatus Methanofishera endochildressiae]